MTLKFVKLLRICGAPQPARPSESIVSLDTAAASLKCLPKAILFEHLPGEVVYLIWARGTVEDDGFCLPERDFDDDARLEAEK